MSQYINMYNSYKPSVNALTAATTLRSSNNQQ